MSHAESKPRVLFLCTGNSCRSQMAEGWMRFLWGDVFEVRSAGTHPQGVNPLAIRAMAEAGVDISHHRSQALSSLEIDEFDYVITVCDAARESCPAYSGRARRLHRTFDDPPHLARGASNEDEAMSHYRRVRDEIRAFVEALPGLLKQEK